MEGQLEKEKPRCGGTPGNPAWRTVFAGTLAVANGPCLGCSDCTAKEQREHVHLPEVIANEFGISRSEARRLIATGGVRLDGKPYTLADIPASTLARKTLTVGKKRRMQW